MSKTATRNGKGATVAVPEAPVLAIRRIAEETLRVPIISVSPLIVHRFSEKAKRQMLDAAQGRKTPKEPKDPIAEYEACFYRLTDGRFAFPADGLKKATVGAARFYGKQLPMTAVKQFVFIRGEVGPDGRMYVPILVESEEAVTMRDDVVRNPNENRYRPQFWPWRMELEVSYCSSALSRESVLSLIDAGGLYVGIGEWRPEKGGTFGTYRIDPDKEVEVLS